MLYDVCQAIVNDNHGIATYEDFNLDLIRNLSIEAPFDDKDYMQLSPNEITEKIYSTAISTYDRKKAAIANQAYPVIKEVYEKQSALYENIVVPISDGQKVYQIVTNLKKSYESVGKELTRSFSQSISLMVVDDYWKEHLREMDELKQSVQNAAYEQKDPLLIYKFEAYELFKTMLDKMNRDVASILVKAFIPMRDPSQVQEARQHRKLDMSKYETSRTDALQAGANTQERRQEPIRVEKKVGRNDQCPCGSGKKYKACHGRNEVGV